LIPFSTSLRSLKHPQQSLIYPTSRPVFLTKFSVINSCLHCYFFRRIRQSVTARASLLYARKPLFICAQYKCECGFCVLLPTDSLLYSSLYLIVLRYTKERGRQMLVNNKKRSRFPKHMFLLKTCEEDVRHDRFNVA